MRDRVSIVSPLWNSPKDKKTYPGTTVYSNVSAFIDPLQGQEVLRALRDASEQWFRITIHYRTGINTSMSVLKGATLYDIRAIANVENKNRLLMLTCRLVS